MDGISRDAGDVDVVESGVGGAPGAASEQRVEMAVSTGVRDGVSSVGVGSGDGNEGFSEAQQQVAPWVVYALYEAGLEDAPFYIGITNDINRRMKQHETCRDSAAYSHVRALDHMGVDCSYVILGRSWNREEALLFETFHIALRPGLRNRNVVECRERLGFSGTFWKALRCTHEVLLEQAYAGIRSAPSPSPPEEEEVAAGGGEFDRITFSVPRAVKLPERLEAARRRRGDRSVSETIRAFVEGGLVP